MMERAFTAMVKTRDGAWMRAVRDFQREMERRVSEAIKQLSGQVHTVPFAPPPEIKTSALLPTVGDAPIPGHAPGALTLKYAGHPEIAPQPRRELRTPRIRVSGETIEVNMVRLGGVHVQIAGILAGYYPEPVKVSILAALCGLTMGGSFSARLSEVRTAGLLDDPARGYVRATEQCAREYLGKFQAPSTTAEVMAVWEPKWGDVHRRMMGYLVARGGEAVTKNELAEAVGMTPGGSFSARLSEVRSSGLLTEPGRGLVAANKEALFLAA